MASLGPVTIDLAGDMTGRIRGKQVSFSNPDFDPSYLFDHGPYTSTAARYLAHFAPKQEGSAGDILAQPYFYLEWYSEANGRCVIELDRTCYQIHGEEGGEHRVE